MREQSHIDAMREAVRGDIERARERRPSIFERPSPPPVEIRAEPNTPSGNLLRSPEPAPEPDPALEVVPEPEAVSEPDPEPAPVVAEPPPAPKRRRWAFWRR